MAGRNKPPKRPSSRSTRLSPEETSALRKRLYNKLSTQIEHAHKVVLGQIEWSPTQARVFSAFLDKVVPNLNASFIEQETRITSDPESLSLDQLRAIAEGRLSVIPAIEHNPSEIPASHPDLQCHPAFQDDPFKSGLPPQKPSQNLVAQPAPPLSSNVDLSNLIEIEYDDSE